MYPLPGSFQTVKDTLSEYSLRSARAFEPIATRLKALRLDTEFFQKICQVVCASLQIKIACSPQPSSLSKLTRVFSAANMQDVYRLFQIPYQYLCPVSLERIKKLELRNLLLIMLCDHFNSSYTEGNDGNIDCDDDNIKHFAEAGLDKHFQNMDETGDAYKTTDEFKAVLQKRFQALKTIHRDLKGVDTFYDFDSLDLDALDIPLSTPSLVAQFENFNWILVNSGCLFLHLQQWNLLQTAQWADNLSSYRGFAWINQHPLERWVHGIVCSAFCLKLCESVRQLRKDQLTNQERRMAYWNVVISCFELAANGAALIISNRLLQKNQVLLPMLAVVAKGIGLIEILTRPSPSSSIR